MAADYTKHTEAQLEEELNAIHAEINRRRAIDAVPAQLENMVMEYVAFGGDPARLQEALDSGKTKKPPAPTPPARNPRA